MTTTSESPRLDRPGENAMHQLAEELGHDIEFARVAAILGVHLSTVHRWRLNGALEAWRLGGRWRTSTDAIRRMVAAGSAGKAAASTPTSRTEAQRREAADAALKTCAALGS